VSSGHLAASATWKVLGKLPPDQRTGDGREEKLLA
jgi:hypothetical protein